MSVAKVVDGSFTGTAESDPIILDSLGGANLSISGTWVGTVILKRSFDNGVTFTAVSGESYTTNQDLVIDDAEKDVQYMLECTAYTSGTAVYHLGAKHSHV